MNKFKKILLLISVFVLIATCLMLVACDAENVDENKIDITYYIEDGESPCVTSIDVGTMFDLSEVPTKSHYTFVGLYDEQGGTIVDANGKGAVVLHSDITIHAKWKPNSYTIHFDANEGDFAGESVDLITADYGTQLNPFPVVEKIGYDFDGWYCGSTRVTEGAAFVSGAEQFLSSYYAINDGEVDLVAQYSIKILDVIFEYNDGENAQEIIKVVYGEKISEDDFPEFDNGSKRILGWTAVPGENIQFDNVILQNITLFPIWKNYKKIEFYISPEDNEPDKLVELFEGDSFTPYIPEKTGYEFDGWYPSPLFSGLPEATIHYSSASTRFYAKWVQTDAVVTFDANGGSVAQSSKNVKYDDNYGELPTPTPASADYVFVGWYTAPSGGEQVTPSTRVKANTVTLYARWLLIKDQWKNLRGSAGGSDKIITDHSNYANYVETVSFNNIDVEQLKENGYTTIKLRIEFGIHEDDDGWQELYFYKGTSSAFLDSRNYLLSSSPCYGCADTEKENSRKEDYIFVFETLKEDKVEGWHTHYFDFAFSIYDLLPSDGSFNIGYGANGILNDNWRLGHTIITVEFSK